MQLVSVGASMFHIKILHIQYVELYPGGYSLKIQKLPGASFPGPCPWRIDLPWTYRGLTAPLRSPADFEYNKKNLSTPLIGVK
jgi:hypothetical protein